MEIKFKKSSSSGKVLPFSLHIDDFVQLPKDFVHCSKYRCYVVGLIEDNEFKVVFTTSELTKLVDFVSSTNLSYYLIYAVDFSIP